MPAPSLALPSFSFVATKGEALVLADNLGLTPLMLAVRAGSLTIVEHLLRLAGPGQPLILLARDKSDI